MLAISVVMAYFNNPGMLQEQYQMFRSYPDHVRQSIEYIVVDDCSTDQAVPPSTPWDIPFSLYRMVKKVRWNQDACRNWGVSKAQAPWTLMTDIDHLIPAETMADLVMFIGSHRYPMDEGRAFRFSRVDYGTLAPYKPHPNSWLMSRELFDKVGGYDERFAGYYGTDGDFLSRVRTLAKVEQLPQTLIRVGREHIPDASTPKSYGRKTDRDGNVLRQLKDQRGNKPPRRGLFAVKLISELNRDDTHG